MSTLILALCALPIVAVTMLLIHRDLARAVARRRHIARLVRLSLTSASTAAAFAGVSAAAVQAAVSLQQAMGRLQQALAPVYAETSKGSALRVQARPSGDYVPRHRA